MHPSEFAKKLADTEKKVRDSGVRDLIQYISSKEEIPPLEFLRLWKAIHMTFWMSDMPLVQQHLARNLASLLLRLPERHRIPYLGFFWKTMVREWHSIDYLRLDKYYMLVRAFYAYTFKLLIQSNWDSDMVRAYGEILEDGPLSVENSKIPEGLRHHIIDNFVLELAKALEGNPLPEEIQPLLFRPFARLIGRPLKNAALKKLHKELFEKLLTFLQPEYEPSEEEQVVIVNSVCLHRLLSDTLANEKCPGPNKAIVKKLIARFASFNSISALEEPSTPVKNVVQDDSLSEKDALLKELYASKIKDDPNLENKDKKRKVDESEDELESLPDTFDEAENDFKENDAIEGHHTPTTPITTAQTNFAACLTDSASKKSVKWGVKTIKTFAKRLPSFSVNKAKELLPIPKDGKPKKPNLRISDEFVPLINEDAMKMPIKKTKKRGKKAKKLRKN